MYYIKKIILTTINDVDSCICLKPGLNIVYGESNTGKSLILDCIDYLLGAKDHRFDEKLRLQSVTLLLDVAGKEVSLSRKINSNEIVVISKHSEIKSNVYRVSGKNSINSIWLKLMGINSDTKIFMTLGGKKQNFTVRTLYHTFLINETRIQGTSSILASGSGINKKVTTSTLTSLLYMATGENYITDESKDDKRTRKIKYVAVKDFAERSLANLEKAEQIELSENKGETPETLQKKIDEILEEICVTEGKKSDLLDQSQKLSEELNEINNKIAECIVLKDRNSSLLTQYKSDIRRLTFIAEGDIYSKNVPILEVCPICNGKLPKKQSKSCINAAIAEVQRVEMHIKDVESVQSSIEIEKSELYLKRTKLLEKSKKIEMEISRKLKPQIKCLRTNLREYTISLNRQKAIEMIDTFSSVLNKELLDIGVENKKEASFNVREKIDKVFGIKLENELTKILRECNYPKFKRAVFDLNEYDLVVDQHKKKTQGQGYRAFLNTVLALGIRNVLDEYHCYRFPMMVIDSPILSLKENNESQRIGDNMKSGLFKYFVEHQNGPQMIVIENEIPNIDYRYTNLIKFTKDERSGRYGLINGYTE